MTSEEDGGRYFARWTNNLQSPLRLHEILLHTVVSRIPSNSYQELLDVLTKICLTATSLGVLTFTSTQSS